MGTRGDCTPEKDATDLSPKNNMEVWSNWKIICTVRNKNVIAKTNLHAMIFL